MGFLTAKWAKAFLAVTAVQAIVCIAFESYVFAKFQLSLNSQASNDPSATPLYHTIPTFLTLFIFGFLYELVLVGDALRMKNTIQVIGICIANLALMIFTAIQIDQINQAIIVLGDKNALAVVQGQTQLPADALWGSIKAYLMAIPIILAFITLVLAFIAWKLYQVFAWDILKQIGADYRMKKRFLTYQIYIALLKFDFFFFIGFTVQFVVIVSKVVVDNVKSISTIEFALTIAAMPLTMLILLGAAIFTRHENRPGTILVIFFYLGGLAYFIFKLSRIYSVAHAPLYLPVRRSLSAFAVVSILLLVCTISNAVMCMMNYGKGLKVHLLRKKSKGSEQPDLNSLEMDKTNSHNRMTID